MMVKDLEKAINQAYLFVESAEKKMDQLIAAAGEATPAAPVDPSIPTGETPAEETSAAATEIVLEDGGSSQDAGGAKAKRQAKKKKADKEKDKDKDDKKNWRGRSVGEAPARPNPVTAAIFEAMDAAQGSVALAQGKARALFMKREDLFGPLRTGFTKVLKDFRTNHAEAMAKEEQLLRNAKKNFHYSVQQNLREEGLKGVTPTSAMIQSMCINLVLQAEERAQDRMDAAHDQAERLLDLIQHMFVEALPALVFTKCSNLGMLDVSLKAFLTLLQWVRGLGAQSFPLGSGTTPATRSDTGELLLPAEFVNVAVGHYMSPKATSNALVEALRRCLPNDPGRVGMIRNDLLAMVQPLVREQAAQAIKDAEGAHAVVNLRDMSADDWAKIFRELVGKGLERDSPLPRLLSEMINSNKEGWTRVLSGVAQGALEPVSNMGLHIVEAALPVALQSKMGVKALCTALNNTDNLQQVSAALRSFVGEHADNFFLNTLSRPGGLTPLEKIIDDKVVSSVNQYVLDIAESTKKQAEWRVIGEAKAWQEKLRSEVKNEVIAELGLTPSRGTTTSDSVDKRLRDLEECLSDKNSPWKSDLREDILTQVREDHAALLTGRRGDIPAFIPVQCLQLHSGSCIPAAPPVACLGDAWQQALRRSQSWGRRHPDSQEIPG